MPLTPPRQPAVLHYAARQKKPARPTCIPPTPARTLPTQAQILRMTRSQLVECAHEHGIELDAGYNLVRNLRRELLAYFYKKTHRRVKMRATLPPGMKMG